MLQILPVKRVAGIWPLWQPLKWISEDLIGDCVCLRMSFIWNDTCSMIHKVMVVQSNNNTYTLGRVLTTWLAAAAMKYYWVFPSTIFSIAQYVIEYLLSRRFLVLPSSFFSKILPWPSSFRALLASIFHLTSRNLSGCHEILMSIAQYDS